MTDQQIVTDAVNEIKGEVEKVRRRKGDGAMPKAMDLHQEKLDQIVKASSALVLDAGRQMGDELEDVLRAFADENDDVLDKISAYVQKAEAVYRIFMVMRDSLADAKKQVASQTLVEPKQ